MKTAPALTDELRAAAVLVTAAYEAAVYLDGPQPPGSDDPETMVTVLRLLSCAAEKARADGQPVPPKIAAVDLAFRLRSEDSLTAALFQMVGFMRAVEAAEMEEDEG